MELLGDPLYKPMRLREIASLLQLDKSEKKELFDVLDELCAQGKAEVDNKGRYSKVSGKRRDRRKNKEALKAEKPERGRKGRERREKNHEEYRFSEKDGTIMEGTFFFFQNFSIFSHFLLFHIYISFLPCYPSGGRLTRAPVSTQKHSC